jgi:hypothetical protein
LDVDLGAAIAPLVDLGRAIFFRRHFPPVLEFWISVSRISPALRCSGRYLGSFVLGIDGRTWFFRGFRSGVVFFYS